MPLNALIPHLQTLLTGVSILTPLLRQYEYAFQFESVGEGSDGLFALGSFIRGDRRITLQFGRNLGSVVYQIGPDHIDHESYMRLLGAEHRFSGMSGDLESDCEDLAWDLSHFGEDFLSGSGAEFQRCVEESHHHPERLRAN